MNPFYKWLIATAIVCVPSFGTFGQEMDAKKLMGENYEVMQRILINLIKEHHELVAKDVDIIIDHSEKISQIRLNLTPKLLEQFRSYAFLLNTRAKNLKIISENVREGKQQGDEFAPKIDYLRDVAAAHFGEVVAMCVRCHNQFR